MRKDAEKQKIQKVKIIEVNRENKKVIIEENINVNQLEINQEKKSIKKNKHMFYDKSLNIKKNSNIFNIEIKKNNKSIQRIHFKFHNKFKKFYFLMISFIIPFINSADTSLIHKNNITDSPPFSENNQTNQTNQSSSTFLKSSEITLKLNQGYYQILSNKFFQRYKPYEIYINKTLQSTLSYRYSYAYQSNSILFFQN